MGNVVLFRRQRRHHEPHSAIEGALYDGRGTRRGAHHKLDKRRPVVFEEEQNKKNNERRRVLFSSVSSVSSGEARAGAARTISEEPVFASVLSSYR